MTHLTTLCVLWWLIKRQIENCVLLGYYSACSGNSLRKFQDNLPVPSSRVKNGFLTFEDGTSRLSRNVRKELPLNAA